MDVIGLAATICHFLLLSVLKKCVCFFLEDCVEHSHLAVSINDRAEKFPGASASVHANHA